MQRPNSGGAYADALTATHAIAMTVASVVASARCAGLM
jgi:hypothetical protein